MRLVRRRFLRLAGAAAVLPTTSWIAAAQGSPKLTQILRADLQGQDQRVQETIASILEMPAGVSSPWHMHPGAQELLFVIEGTLTIEVAGRDTQIVKAGDVGLIPAEIPHLARNENTAMAKALVTHSRADKEKPVTVVVKRST